MEKTIQCIGGNRMEKLKLKDFLAYRYLSAPEFAPDGKICAFVAAQAKEDESGYDRDIWLFDPQSERVRPLTSGGDAGQFWWLDESSLLFPRAALPQGQGARGAGRTAHQFAAHPRRWRRGPALLHHPRARERPARAGRRPFFAAVPL